MEALKYRQKIHEISSTQKHPLGLMRQHDGKMFQYCQCGATAVSQGKIQQAATVAANVTNQAMPATAIGATQLVYTAGGAVTYVADYFKGGELQINDATGESYQYHIVSSTAVTAGTSITITLKEDEPIKVALTTSSEGTLVHNPCRYTVESTTEEAEYVGSAVVPVTALYYYWSQVGGLGICLMGDTSAVGTMLTGGSTAGELVGINSTLDVDQPIVARKVGNAGVDGEYKPVRFLIG